MKSKTSVIGALLLLFAAMAWGGMFPVAKTALITVDAFYFTSIRYGIAALVFLLILLRMEGPAALRLEGRGTRLFLYGGSGFAGFSLFALVGLTHARPEHAAVIVALMPLVTALIHWLWKGKRPAAHTLLAMAAAFLGVLLVISRGDLGHLLAGNAGFGEALVFLGVVSWAVYTLGAADFPDWSPLRYTALSCALGVVSILLITLLATQAGLAQWPGLAAVVHIRWALAYIIVFASVYAVIGWNAGIQRIGAVNGVLFINLVPITAFAIGIWQGKHFSRDELVGAGVAIAALVANNWYGRRTARRPLPPAQATGVLCDKGAEP